MRHRLAGLAATALLLAVALDARAARRGEIKIDPLGSWSCVVYGHPAFGDERMLFHFAPDGTAQVARQDDQEISAWGPLTGWTKDDGELVFGDSRSGRQYHADLRRAALGGSWRTLTSAGGWWCSAMAEDSLPAIVKLEPLAIMPPLVAERTAFPWYPRQAIRDAKQGRAVTCFFVDSTGTVVQPEVVELSDEIFRAPILEALERSRYQGWDDPTVLRPGCRSYIFRLDAANVNTETP